MSKDGIVRVHNNRVYFVEVIRADKDNIRVVLKSGYTLQVPRKNVIRLPEGTAI